MMRRAALIVLWSWLAVAGNVPAQPPYLDKPIHMLVGFPPGSSADSVARWFGQRLAEVLEQPVVVENILGASGNIAADHLSKAAPDGYTLDILGEGQLVINPSLYKLGYDPRRDFAPISQVAVTPNVLVVPSSLPVRNVAELVALAKAKPGELTFASGGIGSSPHVSAELFESLAGIDIRHIPYKGVVAAVPDLLAGRVTMMFSPAAIVLPLVRDGRLRALAITFSRRSPAVPELPTLAESGFPEFEFTAWYGLLAPAGMPAAIVRRLHLATRKALASRELREKFAEAGLEPMSNSPDDFTAIISAEIPRWARVIKEGGIKAD